MKKLSSIENKEKSVHIS